MNWRTYLREGKVITLWENGVRWTGLVVLADDRFFTLLYDWTQPPITVWMNRVESVRPGVPATMRDVIEHLRLNGLMLAELDQYLAKAIAAQEVDQEELKKLRLLGQFTLHQAMSLARTLGLDPEG